MSVVLSRAITLTAGTLYPAYRSYKAIRTKDVREYVKWMMYWIVFAMYTLIEALADIFISFWFPFYYQLKIVFVLWLLSPWTKGASILYRKWIHPTLTKHEQDIDALLEQAKSESYNQLVRLGSRSLLCARDIVAEAALRGQAQLVNQLQRSYSAGDVNREREHEPRKRIQVEGIQEIDDEDGDHERTTHPHFESGDEEAPRRRKNRSRSRSGPRTLEGGETPYNTMPRRSQQMDNMTFVSSRNMPQKMYSTPCSNVVRSYALSISGV